MNDDMTMLVFRVLDWDGDSGEADRTLPKGS
jgi:hypothetical protein